MTGVYDLNVCDEKHLGYGELESMAIMNAKNMRPTPAGRYDC